MESLFGGVIMAGRGRKKQSFKSDNIKWKVGIYTRRSFDDNHKNRKLASILAQPVFVYSYEFSSPSAVSCRAVAHTFRMLPALADRQGSQPRHFRARHTVCLFRSTKKPGLSPAPRYTKFSPVAFAYSDGSVSPPQYYK